MQDFAHTVEGVEIFAIGNWTDSQGQEREWTASDINKLLTNFKDDSTEHPIPVKVGHTDDDFNNQVADELGIPKSLLTGDMGMGAARLGQISKVYKDGDKLKADFENVPDAITELIQAGMYNAVSVEIDMPTDDDPHLSGVAILGAEAPAVGSLASLNQASVFSAMQDSKWVTLSFASGEPEQIDPEELAREFGEISNKMEDLIRGKKGARLLRAFWSEIRKKMSDVTGKKFSQFSAGNWESIIEAQREATLTLPLEVVARLCPDCGSQMGAKGLTKLKVKGYEMPASLKQAIMTMGGDADDGYFTRLMDLDIGVEGGDKMALCAMLTREHTGRWPTLDNGGVDTEAEEPIEHSESEFQPPQLVNWAVGVSFDECVQQLSEPDKGISDPQALCASLKRAAGEMQANHTEEKMNDFVLAPEDLPRLYEALGLMEDATIEDVLAAIAAMKGEEMPEADMPLEMPMSEEDKDRRIAELETRLAAQEAFAKKVAKEKLVMQYTKQAGEWSGVSRKSEEIGAELAEIHDTIGEQAATQLVRQYQAINNEVAQLGILSPVGAVTKDDDTQPDEFEAKVEAYADAHCSGNFNQALGKFAASDPVGFAQYSHRVRLNVVGGN